MVKLLFYWIESTLLVGWLAMTLFFFGWTCWRIYGGLVDMIFGQQKMLCQECGGSGGWVEPVLDYGEGPWEQCGWCKGSGSITAKLRGQWLSDKRRIKHESQSYTEAH